MNKEKLEQMAEEYADKFNNFGGTYHGDVIRHIRIEAFKEALSIPEVKGMREALAKYANESESIIIETNGADIDQDDLYIYEEFESGDPQDVGTLARKALTDLEGLLK